MNDIIFETRNLTRYYADGQVTAVNAVNLKVKKGEFLVVRGPSGSGKSTLLHLLAGLDKPTSGEIYFEGTPLKEALNRPEFRVRNLGFVFQLFYLWPTLNALENVLLPLMAIRINKRKVSQRASSLLKLVGLSDKAKASVQALSVGERQRVAIARALIAEPKIILADEPTGSLDSQNAKAILKLFRNINKEDNVTLVMVTHQHMVDEFCDRTIEMIDGKIKQPT